ncbi:MAG: SMI1/KNR4 family protein [Massilibacteroides sp.]|nr:SMI1/KNR4 family protein [Massilibacteroides sp.]
MFKIEWDKEEVARKIKSGEGGERNFLGFWTPVQVFVNGTDITGLEENPKGDISLFDDLFLNFFYIFYSIDPENLQEGEFHVASSVKNRVDGGGFDLYVYHDKESDVLTLKYHSLVHPDYRILEIPLKDFTEGILQSATEMLEEVLRVAPEFEDDVNYIVLKEDMELVRNWYQERYGASFLPNHIKKKQTKVDEEDIHWIGVESNSDEGMIDCVQKILDLRFPDDYLSCVRKNPGGFPYPRNIIKHDGIKRGRSQFVGFLSFNPKNSVSYILTTCYAINYLPPGVDDRANNVIVPFAGALHNDLLCFDYREGFPPKVVYREFRMKGEEKPLIFLCNSFTELFELMERCE